MLKLKEMFRQRKIPLEQRKLWPVLESGKQIVWVRGFPVAAAFAATPEASQTIIIGEESSPSHETRGEPR